MFTGIITNLGKVEALAQNSKKDLLIKISCEKSSIKRNLELGCSIACNGICLTLVEKKISGEKYIFSFQASKETCEKTTLAKWQIGQTINLEFAMRMGDEFGGHMVLGHVDATAKISEITLIKNSHRFVFEAKNELMKFISEKGSITIDGVSLTVNEVKKNSFSVNIIPHTLKHTAFQHCKKGGLVNLEIDVVARYLEKINRS